MSDAKSDLFKDAVAEAMEAPTAATTAVGVGLIFAGEKAKAKYSTDDLDGEAVPEALREFLTDLVDAAEEYINTIGTAFGIE